MKKPVGKPDSPSLNSERGTGGEVAFGTAAHITSLALCLWGGGEGCLSHFSSLSALQPVRGEWLGVLTGVGI